MAFNARGKNKNLALALFCRGKPSLSIEDVHRCVDEMYADDDVPADIGGKIDRARVRNPIRMHNVKHVT